jgi:hypothetical protein
MRDGLATIIGAALLYGCASTPDAVYQYYPAKATATYTVTQTVECMADKTDLVVAQTPLLSVSYGADYGSGPYSLAIKPLDSTFANADFTMNWYDDGRLKSINQSTTGQGETILKAVITTAATAASLVGGKSPHPQTKSTLPVCERLKDKPVTLTYTILPELGKSAVLDLGYNEVNNKGLFEELVKTKKMPLLSARIGAPEAVAPLVEAGPSNPDDTVFLKLRSTSRVQIEFVVNESPVSISTAVVPGVKPFSLPIPKAALFGKQVFVLSLSETGSITSLQYGKETGAAGAVNVLNAAATAAAPETETQKAAELKAQADLIVQQQRLAKCQANPDQCE